MVPIVIHDLVIAAVFMDLLGDMMKNCITKLLLFGKLNLLS
jgi:hypothetical protein